MTNTALRAENSNSRTITFKSKEHEKFYEEYLEKCRYQDVYHQALVYCTFRINGAPFPRQRCKRLAPAVRYPFTITC